MNEGRASRLKNEIGNEYKLLTVIERAENIGKMAAWLCKCECGNITIVKGKEGWQSCDRPTNIRGISMRMVRL
jgi:hypothetical protein